ncbi:MAG: protein kinase [Planctomycetia bacterium]|nr:protein kinase [Planctomycetia bacterium]
MLNCPYCKTDLAKLAAFPDVCPGCGKRLDRPGNESASVQLLRDSADLSGSGSVSDAGGTMQSGDSSLGSAGSGSGVSGSGSGSSAADNPNSSKTFISDQWDEPPVPDAPSKSDDYPKLKESASVQLLRDSAEESNPDIAATVQSSEFAPAAPAGTTPSGESDDPNISKTFVSDEFDENDVNSLTVQSGEMEHGVSEQAGKTVQFEEADDPSIQKTVHSEEFALQDAAGAPVDRTLISDSFDSAEGVQATMLSDELPAGAVRTMQDMWSGAFEGRTTPGMTIKGKEKKDDRGKSSLVIRERSMVSPGEQKPKGFAAEYELIKILGEGGMGVVYDAKQMSVDRSVAVKMLKGKTAGDEKQRQKFLAEAVVTGELDHPNIVPIYDVGTSDRGLLFYSMKKVKGTPWIKLVTKKSVPENIDILMKVSDAIAFAHSRGVIHRDLKPENIMLGEFGETLVMDWGLALPAPGYAKSDTIATSHSMGGTPAYMAPEMASGPLEKIGFASDIYLLGAILYEVLTGKAPHTGKNTMQCLFAATKNEIRPPENENVSGELMDIALKAMATDPKDRYQNVAEFQVAIREYRMHIESIVLSTRASEELETGERTEDYNSFNRALFGFEEAIKQWDGNTRAKSGLSETKSKYAGVALKKEDFDLGLGLLDRDDPEHLAIYAQLQKKKREREGKQRTLKLMKRGAVVAGVLFVAVISVAMYFVNKEKNNAEIAKQAAVEQKDLADIAKTKAEEQEQEAKEQKKAADIAKEQADIQKMAALDQKMQADIAKEQAVTAKSRAEYEGYVAQIGLAAAKIDENSFESALELLENCQPELRNWEWGRLMYLCTRHIKSADSKSPIDAVAFSPDGSRFITGGWNKTAKIWDTETATEKLSLPVVGLFVHAVAYSPNGKVVATAGNDKRVRLWDAETGAPVKTDGEFAGHTDGVLSVVFSKDGSKLLTGSYDKTARLWDVKTGKELRVLKGHSWWVWSAVFSPDETQVVTASQDGSAIVWDLKSSEKSVPPQFLEHSGPVYTAAFSPDGEFVATGGYDTKILIWRPKDVKAFDLGKLAKDEKQEHVPFRALEGHGGPVRSVSFSKDGGLVLSGSHDNTVKIWEAVSGRTVKTLRGHASWVRACAFSPDHKTVLSASHDNVAKRWNITDYEEVRVLQGRVLHGHSDAILAVSFDRDGKNLVTASRDRTARTWDFRTGGELQSFAEGHAFLASNAAFFPDGKKLITAAVDNTARLWDADSGTQISKFERTGRSAALALTPKGDRILTGGYKRTLADNKEDWIAQVWDVETEKVVKVLEGHKYEVTSVAISPDGQWLFTGDANGRGTLWNAETYAPVHKLQLHTGKISAAVFLTDSSRLLTASTDRTVFQWEVRSGKAQLPLVLKHPDTVLAINLVPNSRQALTCCGDGVVRIWNIDQAQEAGALPKPEKGAINSVSVSADGLQVLTVNPDEKTVRLWDLAKRTEQHAAQGGQEAFIDFNQFSRARGQLWTAMFAPEGEKILTIGGSEARMWDMKRGVELITFSPNGIVAAAGFSPNGERVVTGSWDNAARIWNAKTGVAIRKLEGHSSYVNSAVYSPDGRQILTASDDKTAMLWDAESGKMIREFKGHDDRLRSAVFSHDGKLVLTASNDSTARLWNAETGVELGKFVGHEFSVMSAVFSADSKKVATGGEDKTARIWDVATFKELLETPLAGHTASVASVAFLHDGERVVTGSLDNTAKLWDALTGKEVLTLKGHTQEVTCVGTSDDGRYVVTGSRDGTAVVWLSSAWKGDAAPQPQQQAWMRGARTFVRAE